MRILSGSPEETRRIGESIGKRLRRGDIVLLDGALGSGKTVLISGIVRGMGNGAEVLSPTYPLLNIYEGDINVHHFDWYRLESVEEFYEAALDDYFPGDGVALVEWASALDMEAESALRIAIEKEGDGRRIDLRAPDISRWEGIC